LNITDFLRLNLKKTSTRLKTLVFFNLLIDNLALVFIIFHLAYICIANNFFTQAFYYDFFIILILCLIKCFTTLIKENISQKLYLNTITYLREELTASFNSLNILEKDNLNLDEYLYVVTDSVNILGKFYSHSFLAFVSSLIAFISFSLFLLLIKPIALVAFITPIILVPLGLLMVRKVSAKVLKNKHRSLINVAKTFGQNLETMLTYKFFNKSQEQIQKFTITSETHRLNIMSSLKIRLQSIMFMDLFTYLGSTLLIISALFPYTMPLSLDVSSLSIVILAIVLVLPARSLGTYIHSLRTARLNIIRYNKYIDFKKNSSITVLNEEAIPSKKITEISISSLNFKYSGLNTFELKNINIDFKANSLYAIVGESGCGKSTLAKIIANLYNDQITSVKYYADNQLLFPAIASKKILYINSSELFTKNTLYFNLVFENHSKISEPQILDILRKVKLDNLDLSTTILENAKNLSVGQRQRLIIARALLRNPDVLILDEILSGIDQATIVDLLNLIYELKSTHIIILITHQLYLLSNFDRIYYLEQGQLILNNTFTDLVLSTNPFSNLYNEQVNIINSLSNSNEVKK